MNGMEVDRDYAPPQQTSQPQFNNPKPDSGSNLINQNQSKGPNFSSHQGSAGQQDIEHAQDQKEERGSSKRNTDQSNSNSNPNQSGQPSSSTEAEVKADSKPQTHRIKPIFISCDTCRRRKIKCIREEPISSSSSLKGNINKDSGTGTNEAGNGNGGLSWGGNEMKTQYAPGPEGGPDLRCNQCKSQGSECAFDYVLKKPGPRT